ncbi:hypothetical protein EVJ58_g6919 [Rhodofomes roseus]|uniref:Uncharacterized protein n=1 Tax=Rhodofomes roseus TaxID=34475 RepID=A0A4Y9Y863_9APHY|nr:hypothetical protein EVJ58_g6919 [Rhodofomes roseus]
MLMSPARLCGSPLGFRPQSPTIAEPAPLVPTEPSSPQVKTEPREETIVDTFVPGPADDTKGETETVEVSDTSDQEASRTRSGRRISASKSKAKDKKRSKKAAKQATVQPSLATDLPSVPVAPAGTTPSDTPTAPSALGELTPSTTVPAMKTNRLVSESKKRRRVSNDIGGDADAGGTTNRLQASPTTKANVTPIHRASSVVSYASASPPRDRAVPPTIATSDADATDVEMMDLNPESDNDLTDHQIRAHYASTVSDAARQKRLGKQPVRRNLPNPEAPPVSGPSSGAQRIAKHAIHGAIYQGYPSPPAQYAYDLAKTRSGTQPTHTPSRLPHVIAQRPPTPLQAPPHYPVHYAPGPFPANANGPAQPPVLHPGLPPPLVLTRSPQGGHRPIQGSSVHFFLRNILSSQLLAWSGIDDDFVFVQFPGKGAQDAGNHSRMHAVETVLTKYLNINDTTLFQPLPDIAQPRPNADPRWYRLGNLQPRDRDTLVNGVWWDAPEGTFCVLAPNKMPPTYIGTWRHPHRLGSTTEDGMAESFRTTLESAEPAAYIQAVLDADRRARGRWRHYAIMESFRQVVASVSVRKLTLEAQDANDPGEPVASLYIESPTLDAAQWDDFRTYLRGLTYGGSHAGPPELINEAFFCVYCHSNDHPTFLCTVPNTPGWHGPSLDAVRNAITTERRNMDRNTNNGRGGGRGGRGRGGRGRGRGGYRGRGGLASTQHAT